MSALLLLLFCGVLLLIGFGLNGWTLSALLLLMTSGWALVMSMMDIEQIKRDWKDRRCDLDVLLTSFLYKPASDTRTPNEFATENFSFCVRSAFRSVLASMLSPLLAVIGQSMEATDVLNQIFNKFRQLQTSGMNSFNSIMEPFWDKFRRLGIKFSQVFGRLFSAFRRAAAMGYAAAYSGLSTVAFVMNFTNFSIFVVKVILIILCALMIILFLILAPLIAVIVLPTIYFMQDNGLASVVGPVADCFCMDPNTWIRKQDGTECRLSALKVGDVLSDGGTIEGILEVEKGPGDLFSLSGILVSGSHLVWSTTKSEWIQVRDHPDAGRVPSVEDSKRLLCLRTSTRNIDVIGLTGKTMRFRDWEELPLDIPDADALWDEFISSLLQDLPRTGAVPKDDPMFGSHCQVLFLTGEKRRLNELRIGDVIYGREGFTRITGIYKGQASKLDQQGMTDGTWFYDVDTHKWTHPAQDETKETESAYGWHLTTDTGTFWVETKRFSGFVRDFTEVGADRIHLTYPLTAALLKKSNLQGESCNLDSLSQVS